jgi:molybdopterin synthase catalytic subunit
VRIRVLLFAACREVAGASQLELELADGARVADALASLAVREARLERFLAGSRWARNDGFVGADAALEDGDELAVIPPVSGGSR